MSKRYDNLERWQRIADGALDGAAADTDALLDWVRKRASDIVKADAAKDRELAFVRALGLQGKMHALDPLRAEAEVMNEFSPLDESGNARPLKRGEHQQAVQKLAKKRGLTDTATTNDKDRMRIRR